jgi:GNAT superfamily N-acetyltransferase
MKSILEKAMADTSLNLRFSMDSYYDSKDNINGGKFRIYTLPNFELVTIFTLEQMKGCNGIVISRSVEITPDFRGKGYGSAFCTMRENIAKDFGYSLIVCTIVVGNIPQEKIMAKNGWQKMVQFMNQKTSNNVSLYYKHL